MKHNQGFTLVELVITIAILAILAAIGYSSYERYIVRNAEAQVEARMQSLAMELDRYRSSRLTYRGFVPRKMGVDNQGDKKEKYEYDDGHSVYSNDTKNKYAIEITNASGTALNSTDVGFDGSQWVMFAQPGDKITANIKYKYFMTSTGQRCRSNQEGFKFDGSNMATICQGAGVESW